MKMIKYVCMMQITHAVAAKLKTKANVTSTIIGFQQAESIDKTTGDLPRWLSLDDDESIEKVGNDDNGGGRKLQRYYAN